jgi:hypothetical protein
MMARQFDTYRGFVHPWCIDHVGQMNVQSYVARFDEASCRAAMAVRSPS